MSGHVGVDDVATSDRVGGELHALLHDRFGIEHTTVQVESKPLVQITTRQAERPASSWPRMLRPRSRIIAKSAWGGWPVVVR